ncbi:MAG: SPASM domain-containing protein [Candidatus Berkelbacteria bacterium]|nr:SPASM domain-containing protein [Candidatus Berkelbacteria bacterium]
MPNDLFKKIIDDLAEIHFAGRICPLTNNEPLLDDRIVSFIAYARQKCPLSSLELITNGRLLGEDLLLELFAAGLDSLIINDYRNDRQENPYRLSAKLPQIAKLSESMFRKKIRIDLRSTSEELSNRAGNVQVRKIAVPINKFCALPFTGMWVQPEGKVILCCQDYSYEEVMGDVKDGSLSEIWLNDRYNRIRTELWDEDRTGKICKNCDYSGLPLSV